MNLTPDTIFPEDDAPQRRPHAEESLGMIERLKRQQKKRETGWRFAKEEALSKNDPAASIRVLFNAAEDAPVEHNGDTWAVWTGPGARPAETPFTGELEEGSIETPALTDPAPAPATPEPVITEKPARRISARAVFAGENDLRDIGIQLYELSKDEGYTEELRRLLLDMSDNLHAEASRIELARVRRQLDSRRK
jgi:hypothetical protein